MYFIFFQNYNLKGDFMMYIPKIQDADLKRKIVLIRVDHNVVKKGKIKDTYRIDASFPTIDYIISKGGKPILMSHIGSPRNKETGIIYISEETSVTPIVKYIKDKFKLEFKIPEFKEQKLESLKNLKNLELLLSDLKSGKIDGIYLPNTRWFEGEEAEIGIREIFGEELSSIADIYVNDAFGSWQPHVSTIEPTKHLPSYAGLLMQKEIENLSRIFHPERPLLAVVAGSKFDTKIGPLTALLEMADHLIIGGVIYNAYLCAKYGIKIKGITNEDINSALKFVNLAKKYSSKIVELPYIIESDFLNEKKNGNYRTININEIKPDLSLNYVLDVAPESFIEKEVKNIFRNTKTIFVNAVMGYTPNFAEGTIALNAIIDENKEAVKLFGGGDTLQDFKTFLPDIYTNALKDEKYYFFTGGGTILKAIQKGSATDLEPIKALIENKRKFVKNNLGSSV